MKVPTCSKCDQQHYNFQECPPRQDLKPKIEWNTNDAWGHKMIDLKYLGGNSFVQRSEWDR